METLQLKLFISLSKTLNFTKTANEFYVTQPTVSNYIKSLETSVGVKLLNRDSHSVSLTAEGKEFVNYASQIIALQLEAKNRMHNISNGRRGYLRVAMLSSANVIFSACLEEFTRTYPGVQVNVDLLEGAEMTSAFNRKSHDLYFAHRHMLPNTDDIRFTTLDTVQFHLFVNKNIVDTIDMNDWSTIAKHHFVSTPPQDFTLSEHIDRICEKRGITPDIINYYNRADMAFLAVNAGVGVAILPPQLSDLYSCPNVVGIPIEGEDAAISLIAAWRTHNENPDVENFLKLDALNRRAPEEN
ncbi:MAG: LysR family transcriptional regulator [Oscillospiraceae bacterium]|nr:LysR family transcriptional regulator [Oscillospiraceae bacterium]